MAARDAACRDGAEKSVAVTMDPGLFISQTSTNGYVLHRRESVPKEDQRSKIRDVGENKSNPLATRDKTLALEHRVAHYRDRSGKWQVNPQDFLAHSPARWVNEEGAHRGPLSMLQFFP